MPLKRGGDREIHPKRCRSSSGENLYLDRVPGDRPVFWISAKRAGHFEESTGSRFADLPRSSSSCKPRVHLSPEVRSLHHEFRTVA